MAVRKPGYPWRSRKPLTNREARLISDAANSVTVGGYGIDAVVNHGRTVITNTKPHMSALCRVMTQDEVTAATTAIAADPNWSVAGANLKKHWNGTLADDPSLSVWCMPLQTADEKDALEPILVFLPMGGGVVDNDKVFAVYDYATGRWAGVASPGPYAAKTKLPGPFAVNTSADVRLYNKGVDTGVDLEVHLDWMHNGEDITGEKEVIVMYFPLEDRWRIIGAECEA